MAERRRAQGDAGERQAEALLVGKGYSILERNLRTRWGEVDLIARDGPEVVFVEVKSRRVGTLTPAIESVTPTKLRRLVELAEAYLARREGGEPPWRIDVVTVVLGPGNRVEGVEHLLHVES